jgi:hypothetical protein
LVGVGFGCCFSFYQAAIWFHENYARFEPNNWSKRIDEIVVYSATIFPMLYWFKTPRALRGLYKMNSTGFRIFRIIFQSLRFYISDFNDLDRKNGL